MGDMLAMATDPIADACEDAYEGDGVFASEGWATIPRAVSRALIPGEDFEQFMDMPPNIEPVIELDRLDQIRRVELRRQRVDAWVAPAVLAIAQRAQADHWTAGELVEAVRKVAADYRPRTKRLAHSVSHEYDE